MCDEHLNRHPEAEPAAQDAPRGAEQATVARRSMSRRGLLRGGVLAGGALAIAGGTQLWQPTSAFAVDRPRIYTTDEWGAQPPRSPIQILDPRPTMIVVHHTAGANSTDYSLSHAFAIARSIQQSHFNRGWADSGQHFTISRGGHILVGRHRSLPTLIEGRDHVLGAHCLGQNEESVGIENEGTYTSVQIRDYHYQRLVRMCAYICQQYGILPRHIRGHREYVATECPGDRLFARLPQLRDDVRALLP